MATENILMAAVQCGGYDFFSEILILFRDRQHLHELIREHSIAAGRQVKEEGKKNDLLERIAADDNFSAIHDKLDEIVNPINFIGRCPEQVDEFLAHEVAPLLKNIEEHTSGLSFNVNL